MEWARSTDANRTGRTCGKPNSRTYVSDTVETRGFMHIQRICGQNRLVAHCAVKGCSVCLSLTRTELGTWKLPRVERVRYSKTATTGERTVFVLPLPRSRRAPGRFNGLPSLNWTLPLAPCFRGLIFLLLLDYRSFKENPTVPLILAREFSCRRNIINWKRICKLRNLATLSVFCMYSTVSRMAQLLFPYIKDNFAHCSHVYASFLTCLIFDSPLRPRCRAENIAEFPYNPTHRIQTVFSYPSTIASARAFPQAVIFVVISVASWNFMTLETREDPVSCNVFPAREQLWFQPSVVHRELFFNNFFLSRVRNSFHEDAVRLKFYFLSKVQRVFAMSIVRNEIRKFSLDINVRLEGGHFETLLSTRE